MQQELTQKLEKLPPQPGVYLMKDEKGSVIYVGKAIHLRKRVMNYFREQDDRYQVKFLMSRVVDVDWVVTETEKEALLLENTLIKKHRPRYNIQLRDDKSYASIKLTLNHPFPQAFVTRQIRKDGALYFGPYTSAQAARETVDFLINHFRLRTCSDHEFSNRVRPCLQYQIKRCDAPCVGLVDQAHYARLVDQVRLFLKGNKKELLKIVKQDMKEHAEQEEFEKAAKARDLIVSFEETLEKQSVDHHRWLDQDVIGFYRTGEWVTICLMQVREGKVCDSHLFSQKSLGEEEEVLESFLPQYYLSDQVQSIQGPDEILLPVKIESYEVIESLLKEKYDQKISVLTPQKGDRCDLVDLANRNALDGSNRRETKASEVENDLSQLQSLLDLQNFPARIECYDNSNFQGDASVGALVCFVDGKPEKSGYRRFKIKNVKGPDDYAMMKEVLTRRFLRTLKKGDEKDVEKWKKPDLLVIDGGKGQLQIVETVLKELNITGVDLISLAKEREKEDQDKVYLPGRKNPVLLGRHSNLLHLLMRIRDEAHRFVITYHRKVRGKDFIPR